MCQRSVEVMEDTGDICDRPLIHIEIKEEIVERMFRGFNKYFSTDHMDVFAGKGRMMLTIHATNMLICGTT